MLAEDKKQKVDVVIYYFNRFAKFEELATAEVLFKPKLFYACFRTHGHWMYMPIDQGRRMVEAQKLFKKVLSEPLREQAINKRPSVIGSKTAPLLKKCWAMWDEQKKSKGNCDWDAIYKIGLALYPKYMPEKIKKLRLRNAVRQVGRRKAKDSRKHNVSELVH
jgi:hypothetical protein